MSPILTTITDYLLSQSCQIAVIFAAVAATCWLLRRANAHWRYLLWLIVLAKCLVPPLVTVPVAVLPAAGVATQAVQVGPQEDRTPTTVTTDHGSAPVVANAVMAGKYDNTVATAETTSGSLQAIEDTPRQIASEGGTPVSSPSTDDSQGQAQAGRHTAIAAYPPANRSMAAHNTAVTPGNVLVAANAWRLPQWAAVSWLIGAAGWLLLAAVRAWRIRRFVNGQRRPAGQYLEDETRALAGQLGLRTAPAVWLMDGVSQPFVWGLLRGSIYLPGNFHQADSSRQRQGILMHELAHVARYDAAVNLVQVLVQAAFWFHPLVWWANRKIRQEREKCCDEVAIAQLGASPKEYGAGIINSLVRACERDRAVSSLAVAGSTRNIEERIRTIMQPNRKFQGRASRLAVASVVMLGIVAVPATVVLTAKTVAPQANAAEAVRAPSTAPATAPSEPIADPDPKAGNIAQSEFAATLPNGVTVELIGLARLADLKPGKSPTWWKPDGQLLAEAPYDKIEGTEEQERQADSLAGHGDARQVVLRMETWRHGSVDARLRTYQKLERPVYQDGNMPVDVQVQTGVSGFSRTFYTQLFRDGQRLGNMFAIGTVLPGSPAAMSVGVAAGPWDTVAGGTAGRTVSVVYSLGRATFSDAQEKDGKTSVVLRNDLSSSGFTETWQQRIVAVDKEGKVHMPVSMEEPSDTSERKTRATFENLPLGQIREFQLQLRRYHYVRFRNVATEPGQETDMKIRGDILLPAVVRSVAVPVYEGLAKIQTRPMTVLDFFTGQILEYRAATAGLTREQQLQGLRQAAWQAKGNILLVPDGRIAPIGATLVPLGEMKLKDAALYGPARLFAYRWTSAKDLAIAGTGTAAIKDDTTLGQPTIASSGPGTILMSLSQDGLVTVFEQGKADSTTGTRQITYINVGRVDWDNLPDPAMFDAASLPPRPKTPATEPTATQPTTTRPAETRPATTQTAPQATEALATQAADNLARKANQVEGLLHKVSESAASQPAGVAPSCSSQPSEPMNEWDLTHGLKAYPTQSPEQLFKALQADMLNDRWSYQSGDLYSFTLRNSTPQREARRTFEKKVSLTPEQTKLLVDASICSVDISGGDADSVDVQATAFVRSRTSAQAAEAFAKLVSVELTVDGPNVRLGDHYQVFRSQDIESAGVMYTVKVPRRLAIDVRIPNGRLTVQNVADLTFIGGGSVAASHTTGQIVIRNNNGSTLLYDVAAGGGVDINQGNGKVELLAVGTPVNLNLGNGGAYLDARTAVPPSCKVVAAHGHVNVVGAVLAQIKDFHFTAPGGVALYEPNSRELLEARKVCSSTTGQEQPPSSWSIQVLDGQIDLWTPDNLPNHLQGSAAGAGGLKIKADEVRIDSAGNGITVTGQAP